MISEDQHQCIAEIVKQAIADIEGRRRDLLWNATVYARIAAALMEETKPCLNEAVVQLTQDQTQAP